MTKEGKLQYLDVLAVKAKTDASAREEICRHFRKYIHHLSHARYECWDREDKEQDLWVCFLECLFSYDETKGVHFVHYIMKRLKWKHLNACREKEGDMGRTVPVEEERVPDPRLAGAMTEEEVKGTLARCPMSNQQRTYLDQRLEGKSWQAIAKENHLPRSTLYYQVKRIRQCLVETPEFRETFFA